MVSLTGHGKSPDIIHTETWDTRESDVEVDGELFASALVNYN
jgi:hypothetical protein